MADAALSYSGRSTGDENVGEGGGVEYREKRQEENIAVCWRSAFGRVFFPGILTREETQAGRDSRLYSSPTAQAPSLVSSSQVRGTSTSQSDQGTLP